MLEKSLLVVFVLVAAFAVLKIFLEVSVWRHANREQIFSDVKLYQLFDSLVKTSANENDNTINISTAENSRRVCFLKHGPAGKVCHFLLTVSASDLTPSDLAQLTDLFLEYGERFVVSNARFENEQCVHMRLSGTGISDAVLMEAVSRRIMRHLRVDEKAKVRVTSTGTIDEDLFGEYFKSRIG